MPRKEFESFTRLDASDVNTYLMDQSVMTFGGTAARGSAIPTPVEGMVTYLEDSNSLQLYDGSQWGSTTGVSSGNAIINGAFEINQRNFTSTTTNLAFGFDRFNLVSAGGTVTYSSEAFTLGSAPEAGYEAANFLRMVTSGQSAAADRSIVQHKIESVRTFAGQTVTLSFWAKAASGTPKIAAEIQQVFGTGGSPSATVEKLLGQVTLSTSFQRFSITSTVDSISGKTLGTGKNDLLSVNLWTSAGTDWNLRTGSLGVQNNTIDIWGIQLEAGPVATPFRRNANSFLGELAACQRYYYRAINEGTSEASFATAMAVTSTRADSVVPFPVTMRVAPTALETANLRFGNFAYSTANLTSLTIPLSSRNSATVSGVASGLSAGQVGYLLSVPSTAAFIGFSAEL